MSCCACWRNALIKRPRQRHRPPPRLKESTKMKAMIAKGVTPLLAALLLTACGAPVFKQPTIATPAAFRESQSPAADEVTTGNDGSRWKLARPAEQQPRGQWWLAFNDPALTGLVE